jgi:hypothetical protein
MMTIEQYAELCALMKDTAGDVSKEAAIAAQNNVSLDAWNEAKTSFTAKMSDPSDMGKTAMAFMPLYQAALDKMAGGKEPCTLELFAKIHAEMGLRKDPNDPTKKIDYNIVLNEHGISHASWLEFNSYWSPRVASETDPKFDMELHKKFAALNQQESDRVLGIVR